MNHILWLIATTSTFVLAFFWYVPIMFHKAWCRENRLVYSALHGVQ